LNFFTKQGFLSISKINFIIIGFVIALLFDSKLRAFLLSIYAITIAVLFYVQFVFPHLINNLSQKESLNERLFDFIAYTLLVVYLGIIIRKEYIKERIFSFQQEQKLQKQKTDILEKQQEILSQQEELTTLNQQLEILVDLRTQQLKEQNQQLNDYLDYNNSKIQIPLQQLNDCASKLISLINEEAEEDRQKSINLLMQNSEQLDKITKEINQILTIKQ
jgi:hypothetical protein